jgi:hypothetical protein
VALLETAAFLVCDPTPVHDPIHRMGLAFELSLLETILTCSIYLKKQSTTTFNVLLER